MRRARACRLNAVWDYWGWGVRRDVEEEGGKGREGKGNTTVTTRQDATGSTCALVWGVYLQYLTTKH